MSKKQVSSETPKARARRKAREAQEAREHFGLGLDQLHVAQILACETVRLLSDMVALGGLSIGRPGSELAKLANAGFIEIRRVNGFTATVKCTEAGLKVLIMRLLRQEPTPTF
jgi:hypothetical protein